MDVATRANKPLQTARVEDEVAVEIFTFTFVQAVDTGWWETDGVMERIRGSTRLQGSWLLYCHSSRPWSISQMVSQT